MDPFDEAAVGNHRIVWWNGQRPFQREEPVQPIIEEVIPIAPWLYGNNARIVGHGTYYIVDAPEAPFRNPPYAPPQRAPQSPPLVINGFPGVPGPAINNPLQVRSWQRNGTTYFQNYANLPQSFGIPINSGPLPPQPGGSTSLFMHFAPPTIILPNPGPGLQQYRVPEMNLRPEEAYPMHWNPNIGNIVEEWQPGAN